MFAYCYMLNLPLTGKTRRSNSARKKIVMSQTKFAITKRYREMMICQYNILILQQKTKQISRLHIDYEHLLARYISQRLKNVSYLTAQLASNVSY